MTSHLTHVLCIRAVGIAFQYNCASGDEKRKRRNVETGGDSALVQIRGEIKLKEDTDSHTGKMPLQKSLRLKINKVFISYSMKNIMPVL